MKQKVISGIIAIIILVALLIIGGTPLYIGIVLLSLQAYRELINLKSFNSVPFLIKIFGAIVTLLLVVSSVYNNSLIFGLSYKALAVLTLVCICPTLFIKEYKIMDALMLFGGIIFISLGFSCLILTISYSRLMFTYLVLITIITDTFAMFFGMLIGKHKLIPRVSPNKTIEGSVYGSLLATVIAVIFYANLIGNAKLYLIIPITLLLSIIGQIGDLIFSLIKRENEIKDFSNVIPGHGGVLDRLDSIILVVIAFVLFFSVI